MQPEPTAGGSWRSLGLPWAWRAQEASAMANRGQGIQEEWAGTVHAWLPGLHPTYTVVRGPVQALAPTGTPSG